MSAESDIRALLDDDTIRIIARLCRTPQSSSQIVKAIFEEKKVYNFEFWAGIVASKLSRMETAKAIVYAQGKWKITELTLNVLAKYYGG